MINYFCRHAVHACKASVRQIQSDSVQLEELCITLVKVVADPGLTEGVSP